MKTYYKVVSHYAGSFYSAVFNHSSDAEFRLEYAVGKTTVPNIGRIYIFQDLESAKIFIQMRSDQGRASYIFEGYATNVGKPKMVSSVLYKAALHRFWKNKGIKITLPSPKDAPKGTLTCSAFTPTKMI
jgi:hypothetical protein